MKIIAEYIWIDGNRGLRSKTRTCIWTSMETLSSSGGYLNVNSYKNWNYDGSSTGQAEGSDSEVIIKPVRICIDPFRGDMSVLVLCDAYYPDGRPVATNTRSEAKKIFDRNEHLKPWYGIEQEFFIMKGEESKVSIRPVGLQILGCAEPQGQYYCSVGGKNAFGREIAEEVYQRALEAGIQCSGMNAEVAPAQWEIQVGPCLGIDAADQLIILRYILERVSELHNVQINLDPKPISGDWNGSGCHTNFSTTKMRNEGGYGHIINAIKKLEIKHAEHMKVYGQNNHLRMTGQHETASYDTFSYGVANRGASIRIPRETEKNKKGYFEDRRPASNMDPYLVTSKILDTIASQPAIG
jgi:glutamine synthetase